VTVRVALLDDHQGVALAMAPWDELGEDVAVTAFTDHVAGDDALVERLAGFEVVVAMRERTPFTRARLERLPDLRLLVTTGMANAAIDLDAARERGVTVAGTGSLVTHTAELTWALVLALTRNVAREDRGMRAGGWQHTIGPELAGRTLGVIGLGRQGSRVAAIGLAFGMQVVAWSQDLDPAHARSLGAEPVGRDELLERADVVTIHLRLSDRTRGLIGTPELDRIGPEGYLVNTSRGPIVDEGARIAGAGLDVFDVEPLPADHPLRSAPNTVLTPHLGYVTTGNYELYYRDALEDVAAYLRGDALRVLT
jgi:phosphoglycerate dehydrogenase-like enzyme